MKTWKIKLKPNLKNILEMGDGICYYILFFKLTAKSLEHIEKGIIKYSRTENNIEINYNESLYEF